MQMQSRFSILLLLIISFFTIIQSSKSSAQNDEALNRIDQAMAHLSDYLGRDIDREAFDWRWSERIFPDNSLDCPLAEQNYAQQQIRAYQVRIFVDGTEYDYRLSADGALLVLCINGNPDPTSQGVPVPDEPIQEEIVDSTTVSLDTNSPWWAWTYALELDTMYLINATQGEVAALPRPHLPDEITGLTPKLAISRDGRILIVANALRSGVNGLGFYAFETGNFIQTYPVRPGEDVFLGFGYDNSNVSGTPFITSVDDRFIAIGFANTDFSNPSWRIVVFDLNTGEALYQLEHSNPQIAALGAEYGNLGIVFPRIVYFGDDEIHFQLIRFGAGAEPTYPAIAWQPNRNVVTQSRYVQRYLDILPLEEPSEVTAYVQDSIPTSTDGLFPANNTIGIVGSDFEAALEPLYTEDLAAFSQPQWAADGDVILFRKLTPSGLQWQQLQAGTLALLPEDVEAVYGHAQGYLMRTAAGEVQNVNMQNQNTIPIWQAPQGIQSMILWATPLYTETRLDQVFIPLNLTGIVHCPNTQISEVAIGFEAVSQVSLRMRDVPGGEYVTTLNEGTAFLIISGPQCQGTYTWWQVRLENGQTGWAAEADADLYFMTPLESTDG